MLIYLIFGMLVSHSKANIDLTRGFGAFNGKPMENKLKLICYQTFTQYLMFKVQ